MGVSGWEGCPPAPYPILDGEISSLPSESGDCSGSRAHRLARGVVGAGSGAGTSPSSGVLRGFSQVPAWRTFPIFSMWFRKRSRGRSRAPVDGRKRRRRASGGPTDVTHHEGFFRHPLGWHPLGRASAGGPEMPDGRPLRGGSGSNAVRGRFFVSVKPCQGLCRRGSLLGPSTVPSPAPWRRRRREVALGCDTFAGPEGAGGVL